VTVYSIRNGASKVMTLRVEPWGRQYTMQPGTAARIGFEGPAGAPESEWTDDALVVSGWVGATVRVDLGFGWADAHE
jgi:hypothetical protein